MILIRPHVLRSAADPNSLTLDRYDCLRGGQKDSQVPARAVLPNMNASVMPPLNQKSEPPLNLKTEPELKPGNESNNSSIQAP